MRRMTHDREAMLCGHPGCSEAENRIDGYCSIYCRDTHELEEEIAELKRRANAAEILLCDIGDVLGDTPDDESFRQVMGWMDPLEGPTRLMDKIVQVRAKVMEGHE